MYNVPKRDIHTVYGNAHQAQRQAARFLREWFAADLNVWAPPIGAQGYLLLDLQLRIIGSNLLPRRDERSDD